MLEFLKRPGQALTTAARRDSARAKAAVTFAARLTFEDVSRRYGEMLALDRVSLDICSDPAVAESRLCSGSPPASSVRLRAASCSTAGRSPVPTNSCRRSGAASG